MNARKRRSILGLTALLVVFGLNWIAYARGVAGVPSPGQFLLIAGLTALILLMGTVVIAIVRIRAYVRALSQLRVGGFYALRDGWRKYSVVKILAIDQDVVHARHYKERFTRVPRHLDPAALSLGRFDETSPGVGFSIGSMPVAKEEFAAWRPILIGQAEVTDEELEGYRMFKSDPQARPWSSEILKEIGVSHISEARFGVRPPDSE